MHQIVNNIVGTSYGDSVESIEIVIGQVSVVLSAIYAIAVGTLRRFKSSSYVVAEAFAGRSYWHENKDFSTSFPAKKLV